jgi:DNA-binding beta-propeller fold protein YncE
MAVRSRRTSAVTASILATMAFVVPSASAAADTTPPSAPTNATWQFEDCFLMFYATWRPSTDNVDGPADLKYRFYRDGRPMTVLYPGGTEVQGWASGENWASFHQAPDAVRAVDRAGNVSAPATVAAARLR